MKIDNRAIIDLGRAITGSSPVAGDNELDLSNDLAAVIELRQPISSQVSAAGTVQNSTTAVNFSILKANVAGVTDTLGTFAAGLWDFEVVASMCSNYLEAVASPTCYVWLNIGGNLSHYLSMLYAGGAAAAPNSITMRSHHRILVAQQFAMARTTQTNAAGQQFSHSISVLATKLL